MTTLVYIVNCTRNRQGFENEMVIRLIEKLKTQGFHTEVTTVENIEDFTAVRKVLKERKPAFLLFVAHGRADGEGLDLIDFINVENLSDEGVKRQLESYYILDQLIGEVGHEFFGILAVCEGYCTDSLATFGAQPNLRALIAPQIKVCMHMLHDFISEFFEHIPRNSPPDLISVETAYRIARDKTGFQFFDATISNFIVKEEGVI